MVVKRVKVIIEGRVQGVGYRMFVRDLANQYHISGWVRNREDGSVEGEIEGESQAVDEIIEKLYAREAYIIRVDQVKVTETIPIESHGFEIRR